MDLEKIGHFIRTMRKEKNWSQEALADKLYCDRTKINRIENGRRNVKLDDLILLSEIFDLSLDEIIAGERKDKNNKKRVEITFKEYLKTQNTKIKRLRSVIIILVILLISIFSLFTIIYFFQNYKSIRVYKFSGSSENYEINDGLLILSKEKIYLKVNNIVPTVDEISVYSEQDNKQTLIYSGNSDIILNDNYGYSALISYKDFIKSKQKTFIVIKGERIDLNFREDFVNSRIFYKEESNVGHMKINETLIPKKIKESFQCDDDSCHLDLENEKLLFNNGILSVVKGNKYYSYDLGNSLFEYQNQSEPKSDFVILISDNDITCMSGNCKNSQKIYEDFYESYILKYLN